MLFVLKNVRKLESEAFYSNEELTDIYLPESLEYFSNSFRFSRIKCVFVENNNSDITNKLIEEYYFDPTLFTCPMEFEIDYETEYLNIYRYRSYIKKFLNTIHQYGSILT